MSKFAAFLKSPVGKFHTTFAVFILFNLLSGLLNLWVRFLPWLDMVHFYTGLLIVIAPLVYLLVTKNRGIVWKAFVKMTLPGKGDYKKGKRMVPVFKVVTLLMVLLIVVNAVGGVLMKLQVLLSLSIRVHIFDFKVLLALVPLHVLLGFWVRGAHTKKPAKVRRAPTGNTAQ